MAILKRGLAGEPVKLLQRKLGVEADGRFGPGTETALKAYQTKNGLQVDGIAGPDTFVHMELYELVLLRTGSRGETVRRLQQALGVAADGAFGAGTEKAVRAFQERNGLDVDGMAGPATLAKTGIFKEMTPDIVKRSEVGAPASGGAAPGGEAATEPAPSRSIWGTIKSFFGA
ncbi:peptidoglycan-binding protein [Rhodoplanes sp. TEM]|uniref:Peptidoglycan-binding protein n=1 Tax=Rhodoplanes tepidamans TaxID=200616 RepID=A0ABT5J8W8_RHOTP|nr:MULTISPECIES: peptidoglycan-binding protein [Rhodoplanes]MDC7785841.1 peptidoglycan-binding protein [Rhodoplanes tepidamans]MDC7982758.1 peptidoglycan-binding protein [Rhodoplanes sp. TEM]MDQ0357412.1 peptidoglycan hydrolase-like protein with peptidoglycan-binding domain [Rhodoplanes tepidamans]